MTACVFTVEIDLTTDDIIGAKEQIALNLEGIGKVRFPNVEERTAQHNESKD